MLFKYLLPLSTIFLIDLHLQKLQNIKLATQQDPNEDLTSEAMTTLADNLTEIKNEIDTFRVEEKSLKTKLSALLGTQTTSELLEVAAREIGDRAWK